MTMPGGLLDRIGGRLFPAPPTPADGLITEEDVRNAQRQGMLSLGAGLLSASGPSTQRTTFGQALGQSLGQAQQGYQGTLDNVLDRRGKAATVQALQTKSQRERQLQELRAQIAERYPAPDGTDDAAMEAWARKVYPIFLRAGDDDAVHSLTSLMQSLRDKSASRAPIELRLGDHVELLDPVTRQPIGSYKINPSPRDPSAPDHAAELSDQRRFTREQQLGDDFNKDTTTPRQTAAKLKGAISEVPAAMNGDGAAQVNILYAFVNAMDPQSAVREGEIGLAKAAAPIWSTANGYLQRILKNESVIVPAPLVKQMGELMKRRYEGLRGTVKERVEYYQGRARRWKVAEDTFVELPPLEGGPPVQPRLPGESIEQYMTRTGKR